MKIDSFNLVFQVSQFFSFRKKRRKRKKKLTPNKGCTTKFATRENPDPGGDTVLQTFQHLTGKSAKPFTSCKILVTITSDHSFDYT